jgi:tRNA(fMet)-specific endonuclease VapC
MGIILDSSVLIRLERQAASIPSDWFEQELSDWFEQELAIAAATAAELLAGVERADDAHRAARSAYVEGILAIIPTVPFDLTIARLYAQVEAQLASSGTPIDRADLAIAVTALSRGWAVATLNTADFTRVPGLAVISLEELLRDLSGKRRG